MIKILGLLKSFAFLMLSILWAFFQKWIDKANKRLIKPCRVSKKSKWAYFGGKIEIYGHDQNIWCPEKFCLCDVEHFGSLFSKMDRPIQKNQHQKGKTFQETQYFGRVHKYHFFPPKYVDFYFLDTLYG